MQLKMILNYVLSKRKIKPHQCKTCDTQRCTNQRARKSADSARAHANVISLNQEVSTANKHNKQKIANNTLKHHHVHIHAYSPTDE